MHKRKLLIKTSLYHSTFSRQFYGLLIFLHCTWLMFFGRNDGANVKQFASFD